MKQALLELYFLSNIGIKRANLLLSFFKIDQILELQEKDLKEIGLNISPFKSLFDKNLRKKAEELALRELKVFDDYCSRGDFGMIFRGTDEYPNALKSLHYLEQPLILWVKGKLPQLEENPNSFAIVGTRKADLYGVRVAEKIASDLSNSGVTVISGLAKGIDAAAHRAALKSSIAVLGHGLNYLYPAENRNLAEKLILVSEYSFKTSPKAHLFPQRNRIIAALSSGVLFVQGEEKSGATITALKANDIGRTVFAIPSNIFDPLFSGSYALLRDGAVITYSVDDIFRELPHLAQNNQNVVQKSKTEDCVNNEFIDLSEEEREVLVLLKNPLTIDKIIQMTSIDNFQLDMILLTLQAKGIVEEIAGRFVIKNA